MQLKCAHCGYIEETTMDLFIKIIGSAMPIGGYFAWVTYFFAGTGFAMPIVIAIIGGGTGLLVFKEEIIKWLINKGHKCPKCASTDWK